MSAFADILDTLRKSIERQRIDPSDRPAVRGAAEAAVAAYGRDADVGLVKPMQSRPDLIGDLVEAVCGYGALTPLLNAGDLEEISIEGDRITYHDAQGALRVLGHVDEAESLHVVERLLDEVGVPFNTAHAAVPGVEVLPDGGACRARLAATRPPVSRRLSVSIRLYTRRAETLDRLVTNDMLSAGAADLLRHAVRVKGSMLIGGPTRSGKTTLLSAIIAEALPTHTVRICEQHRELEVAPVSGASYQVGDVPYARTLGELVQLMLRFDPDILPVGEVRGEEAIHLMRASRVGAGFLCTIHAADGADTLEQLVLTSLDAKGGDPELVRATFSRSLHLVVFCDRSDAGDEDNLHQVMEIRAVLPQLQAHRFQSEVLFTRDRLGDPLVQVSAALPDGVLATRIQRRLPEGVTIEDVMAGRAR